jgi:hypothetical protein
MQGYLCTERAECFYLLQPSKYTWFKLREQDGRLYPAHLASAYQAVGDELQVVESICGRAERVEVKNSDQASPHYRRVRAPGRLGHPTANRPHLVNASYSWCDNS